MANIDKGEIRILQKKLKEIGEESLVLIYKCKDQPQNGDYEQLTKINRLAHECHKSLNRYF